MSDSVRQLHLTCTTYTPKGADLKLHRYVPSRLIIRNNLAEDLNLPGVNLVQLAMQSNCRQEAVHAAASGIVIPLREQEKIAIALGTNLDELSKVRPEKKSIS